MTITTNVQMIPSRKHVITFLYHPIPDPEQAPPLSMHAHRSVSSGRTCPAQCSSHKAWVGDHMEDQQNDVVRGCYIDLFSQVRSFPAFPLYIQVPLEADEQRDLIFLFFKPLLSFHRHYEASQGLQYIFRGDNRHGGWYAVWFRHLGRSMVNAF
jgi:hypothetical protein